MKKVTRFMSMVIAVIMLVSLVPMSVMAADKGVIDGLYVDYSNGCTVEYATDYAYNGSRSVKINANGSGGIWLGDPVGDFKMDPTKAYGLEFYIYVDSWTSGKLWLKPTGKDNSTYPTVYYASLNYGENGLYAGDTNGARWGVEKITEGDKAGWYRVWNKTAIISEKKNFNSVVGFGKGYMWNVDPTNACGKFSIRLDNINVYEWTGYTTAQNSGTRGETPVFVQDFDGEKLPQVEAPKKEDLITKGVNLTPNQYNGANGFYGITTARAYSGERSLYIDSTNGLVGLGSCDTDFGMENNTPYGIKFSIYIEENQSGSIQLWPCNGAGSRWASVYYTTVSGTSADGLTLAGAAASGWNVTKGTGDKAGWYTFESTYPIITDTVSGGAFKPGNMFTFNGKFKAYLDNIQIYNWTKPAGLGDVTANGMGTTLLASNDFEKPSLPQVEAPKKEDLITTGIKLTPNPNNGANGFYGITTARAFSGERSIYIDSTNGLVGLGSGETDFDMEDDTPYGIKFSLYVEENASGNMQLWPTNGAGSRWASVYYTTVSGTSADGFTLAGACKDRWTVIEGTGDKAGWYTFESKYPIITDSEAGGLFKPGCMFVFDGKFKAYLDNIEIYNWTKSAGLGDVTANGMGTTLLASNDFEKQYTLAKNLMATQVSGTQISVSWRNPAEIPPTEIKLYDAEENELIAENFDTTADAVVEYLDEDFTADQEKIYKVDFIYADGSIKSQVAGILPTGSGYEYRVGNWKLSASNPKAPMKLEIDDKVYRTSAPSIRVSSNEASFNTKHGYLELKTDTELDTTKKYRITGSIKKNKAGYIFSRAMATYDITNEKLHRIPNVAGTWANGGGVYSNLEWTDFSHDVFPAESTSPVVHFIFTESVEDFWIDDVACYELDENGNPTGENLVEGIGTLDSIEEQSEAVGVEAINDVEKAIIRWHKDTETEAGAKYVAVYDNAMSSDIPVAYVPVSMGYVDIANLIPGVTYSYTVKAVNAEGRESAEGVIVTATPQAVAMIIGEYETSKSGNDVTVSIDIKNNTAGNNVTAQLILAVYNGVTLSTITGTDATSIPQTALGVNPVTLSKTVTVPTGHRLVMYLWNSMEGMRPLKPSQEY